HVLRRSPGNPIRPGADRRAEAESADAAPEPLGEGGERVRGIVLVLQDGAEVSEQLWAIAADGAAHGLVVRAFPKMARDGDFAFAAHVRLRQWTEQPPCQARQRAAARAVEYGASRHRGDLPGVTPHCLPPPAHSRPSRACV